MNPEKFLAKIQERESAFNDLLANLRCAPHPLILCGSGFIANLYYDVLVQNGIQIAQVAVFDNYIDNNKCCKFKDREVLSLSKALELYESSNILIAFATRNEPDLREQLLSNKKIENVFIFDMMNKIFDDSINLPYAFVHDNIEQYLNIYNTLCDDISRDHMIRILNQRISGNTKYLGDINFIEDTYFPEMIQLSNNEVFIDCGAYIGNVTETFVRHCENLAVEYSKIYALEPDINNFHKLEKLEIRNCTCINKGLWHKYDVLGFSLGKDKGSAIDNTAKTTIVVDSIDNILDGQRATFIKMDIEGAELEALAGAEKTIKKFKPKLAISVYHRKDDILTIPNYIQSLNMGYKLYLRAYSNLTEDFILYAV